MSEGETYKIKNTSYVWLEQNKDVVLLQETHLIDTYKEDHESRWNDNSINAFSDSQFS